MSSDQKLAPALGFKELLQNKLSQIRKDYEVGDTVVRVVLSGRDHGSLREGQALRLGVLDCMAFEDDGSLDEMLRIRT